MLVGVPDPGEQAAAGGEVVAVQVVVGGLEQHEQAEQHRDLYLCRAGELALLGLEPDAAEQVVHERRGDQPHDHDRHAEVHQVVPPRQAEDVVTHVLVEVGVLGAERLPVAPQQELPPLPGTRTAGEEPDHDGDAHHQPPPQRIDHLAVAVEVGLLVRGGPEQRPEPVGQHDVERHDDAHHQPEHREEADLDPEDLGVHRPVVRRPPAVRTDAAEPQPVGPDAGEHRHQEERDHHHDDGADQRPGPARGSPRRPAHVARCVVEESAHAARPVRSVLKGPPQQL